MLSEPPFHEAALKRWREECYSRLFRPSRRGGSAAAGRIHRPLGRPRSQSCNADIRGPFGVGQVADPATNKGTGGALFTPRHHNAGVGATDLCSGVHSCLVNMIRMAFCHSFCARARRPAGAMAASFLTSPRRAAVLGIASSTNSINCISIL
jgi:hypothetical protein